MTSYINDFYESEEEIPCSQEEQSVKKTKTVKKQAPKKAIKKKAAQQLRVTPALTESDSDEEEQPVKRKKTLKQIVPRSFLDDSEEETQVKPIIAKKLNSLLWRRVPSGYTSQRNFAKKGEFYIELRISNSREAEEKDGYKNTLITYKSCVDSNSKSYKAAEKLVKAAKEEFKNIQPILYPKVK